MKKKKRPSVKKIFKDFKAWQWNLAWVERILELPQRTMARWKTGKVSATSEALIRMIHAMPWLLDVAEKRYNEQYARGRLIAQVGIQEMEKAHCQCGLKHEHICRTSGGMKDE